MTILVKQSTAVILKLGPFVDSTDGVTAETALTIAQADLQVSKNGAALAQTSDTTPTTTHDADGWYPIPLTATDTGTLGMLAVQVAMSGALPVWVQAMVVPANVWDSLFGADKLQVDLQEWIGVAPAALSSQRVQTSVAALQAGVITAAAIATDAITAAKIAANAITAAKIQDGALTAAKFASGAFDAVWTVTTRLLTAGTNIVLAKGTGITGLNDPASAAIADQVWDEAKAGHVAADSFGEEVQAHALSSELPSEPPAVSAIADQVWDEAIAGHAGAGSTGEALSNATAPTAAAVADAVWDEATSGHAAAGSTGKALSDAVAGSLVGPGATQYAIKIDDGTNPVQGADVWVSTDAGGASVVAGPLQTDSLGEVTFLLDTVAYYAWTRKDGFNGATADAFTVV